MPSETTNRHQGRAQTAMQTTTQPPPKPSAPLPCPRCDSTNTKFCYYNNYNLCQPRYFCKGCRRYWTQGGTLRNVPVGGGTRKSSKRSRSSSASSSTNSTNSSSNSATSTSTTTTTAHEPESITIPVSGSGNDIYPDQPGLSPGVKVESPYDLNLNEKVQPVMTDGGNFMSFLNSQEHGLFMGMNGYGSGFGYGFCEMGLGFGGRGVWSCPGIGNGNGNNLNDGAVAGAPNSGCNTWQVGDVEGSGSGNGSGLVDGDYFAWPGLAITTPGKALK